MSAKSARDAEAVVYGGVPRVDLMPPEVEQNRRDGRTRRALGALVLSVALIVVAGVAAAAWWSSQAQTRLTDAQNETLRIQQERLQFAEVTQVQARLETIQRQREELAATEILWQETLDPYLAIVGADGSVEGITALGVAPGVEPLGVSGPLRSTRVASVGFTVLTPGVPDSAGWLRSMSGVDTFADASVDSITGDGENGYTTTITLNINEDAYSERFVPDEDADQ